MGSQRGSPTKRIFKGVKYTLYKDYDLNFGEDEQKQDLMKLKAKGIDAKKITTKKDWRVIDRSIYVKEK